VDLGGLYSQAGFDVLADRLRPRFCPEDAVAQARLLWADPALCERLCQSLTVSSGAGDDARLQVEDQRHLPLRHAARDRYYAQSQALGAAMQAEPACEQAVAVGVMEQHARRSPCSGKAAGVHLSEQLEVVAGVTDDGGLASSTAGGVHPCQFVLANCEHPQRVVVMKVVLAGDGQRGDVV